MVFKDRTAAGQLLAGQLSCYADCSDVLVLALPRGGVPVAFEVAKELDTALDVFLVRKLGVPEQPELAMGAIASGGVRVLNDDVVQSLHLSNTIIEKVAAKEQQELERRERLYRDDYPAPEIRDRIVILIDDGLATGATMRAAVRALRQQDPAQLIVAVPIAAPGTCREFESEADRVVCAETPHHFFSVGLWYEDFSQTTDEQVCNLLKQATNCQTTASHSS